MNTLAKLNEIQKSILNGEADNVLIDVQELALLIQRSASDRREQMKENLKTKEEKTKEEAENIFSLIEDYSKTGPYRDAIRHEASNMEVFEEIKQLARKDYLEHVNADTLDEEELEEYNNPTSSFYTFTIIDTKPNGVVVFTV